MMTSTDSMLTSGDSMASFDAFDGSRDGTTRAARKLACNQSRSRQVTVEFSHSELELGIKWGGKHEGGAPTVRSIAR